MLMLQGFKQLFVGISTEYGCIQFCIHSTVLGAQSEVLLF